MARGRYWIQEAIKRPGALRSWISRNRARIRRLTGEDPLSREGKIKVRVLRKLRKLHREGKIRLSGATVRRINLAITLSKLRRE